jgi:mRNA-degrading endonuclease YafQ of YafQ-DinJ toxin-antitoxin module
MRAGGEREGGIERENGKEKKKKENEIKAEWRKKRETIVTVDLFMVSLIDSAQESMNELALTRLVNR